MLMTRRELVDLAIRAAALPGGAEFMAAWLHAQDHNHSANSAAPAEPARLANWTPKFFSAEDFSALQAFTEILIPTDDTPGAKEAHCAHYIDFLMTASDGLPVQQQWHTALASLRNLGFHSGDSKFRAGLVAAMSKPEVDKAATHPGYDAYRLIKQQNTFAFYTSRPGLIETLDYKGNSYNPVFPACTHPEHQRV